MRERAARTGLLQHIVAAMSSSVAAKVDGVAKAKGAIVYIEHRVNQRVRPEQFVGGDAAGASFQIVQADAVRRGWRAALQEVPAGPLRRVHRHPDSEECFAPLGGAPCIVMAEPDTPDVLHLDPPLRWAAPERSER